MPRQLTLIERLVDQACGYCSLDPWEAYRKDPEHVILLECESCHRLIITERHPSDPKSAARITYPCPRCHGGVCLRAVVQYYDAEGKRVKAPWE